MNKPLVSPYPNFLALKSEQDRVYSCYKHITTNKFIDATTGITLGFFLLIFLLATRSSLPVDPSVNMR